MISCNFCTSSSFLFFLTRQYSTGSSACVCDLENLCFNNEFLFDHMQGHSRSLPSKVCIRQQAWSSIETKLI